MNPQKKPKCAKHEPEKYWKTYEAGDCYLYHIKCSCGKEVGGWTELSADKELAKHLKEIEKPKQTHEGTFFEEWDKAIKTMPLKGDNPASGADLPIARIEMALPLTQENVRKVVEYAEKMDKPSSVLTDEEREKIKNATETRPNPYFKACREKHLGIEEGRCDTRCPSGYRVECKRGEIIEEPASMDKIISLTEQAVLAKCRAKIKDMEMAIDVYKDALNKRNGWIQELLDSSAEVGKKHRAEMDALRNMIISVMIDYGLSNIEAERIFESEHNFELALKDVLEKEVQEQKMKLANELGDLGAKATREIVSIHSKELEEKDTRIRELIGSIEKQDTEYKAEAERKEKYISLLKRDGEESRKKLQELYKKKGMPQPKDGLDELFLTPPEEIEFLRRRIQELTQENSELRKGIEKIANELNTSSYPIREIDVWNLENKLRSLVKKEVKE